MSPPPAPAASSPPSICWNATPTAAAGRSDVVDHLCVDAAGALLDTCERDGERENYLAPKTHRVVVRLTGAVPAGATCNWSFDDGTIPPQAGQRGLLRSGAAAPALRQADHRRRRHHAAGQQRRERLDRDRGARPPDRGPRRLGRRRRRQSRPADRARRRGLLLPALPRHRAQRIFPAEPARLRGRQGLRRQPRAAPAPPPPTTGSATAPAGCRRPATARSTAISCAPRSRSRSRTRSSPSPSCRSPAPAPRSRPACSARKARANVRRRGRCAGTVPAQIEQLQDALAKARKQDAEPQARSRPAHGRRQRHQVLRPRRRRHHHRRRRARAVQPGRPDRLGAAGAAHSRSRLSRRLRQAARRAQAAGRRQPVARRLRVLRPSGDAGRRDLPRRPRRPRRASGVHRRRRAAAARDRFRADEIPAEAEGAGALRGRSANAPIPTPTA